MASLWKHPQCKYWFACFTAIDGRRLKRSTRTTDRRKAQKIADEYEKASRQKRTARQVRTVIAELHEQITGGALSAMTARAYFAEWISRKGAEVETGTMDFYKQTPKKFLEFLGDAADAEIELVTADQIVRFRNEQAAQISSRTVNHNLKCLRAIFKAAKREGYISENPAEFVDNVKQDSRKKTTQRRAFTLDELKAIITVADDEWCSMIRLGLYTGQRLGDIASLTRKNIDLEKGVIRLETKKTRRTMEIPIAAPLRVHLEALPVATATTPLHPAALKAITKTGKVSGLSNKFGDILATAGLREARPKKHAKAENGNGRGGRRERQELSFHSLRDTATTFLHEAGIPSSVAQELIGHDSEQVHAGYVKVGREAMEKAAAAFPTL